MKFKRRQILLGGIAAGVTANLATDYHNQQKQDKLKALAKEQMSKDKQSLLQAAFEADAEKIYQGQKIIDAFKPTPPTIPYDREVSKLLIQSGKIATQQYLTGKTISNYDGSIKKLPAYSSNLNSYTQIASFQGKESEISETVPVNLSDAEGDDDRLGNFSDPLQSNLDEAEQEVGQAIQEMVKITREVPVYLGFVLTSAKNNIIVFRGTQTKVEWLNNFTAVQKEFTDPLSGKYFGKIHEGFIKNYLRIVQPLPREIAQTLDPKVPCYITGHSLGASLAVLAALDIALNLPQLRQQIQLYTYASPRVGDPTFAQLHTQQVPNSYRVVNLADSIPLMPPTQAIGTYLHVGQEWSFLSQKGDFMPNHVVDTYQTAIDREVETDSSRVYPLSGLA
jgi:predicted lipase